VQDALRLKAVNRPLTYALKDIALDLQVFAEVDAQGNVRFRSSGPNETGASTIRLGFTTITRPMIEENTVSLEMSRSPRLDELGLDEGEKKQLEQLGVRNAAQLQNLGNQTSATSVSRLTGISVERLREALSLGKPRVTQIVPEKPASPIHPPPRPLPTVPPKSSPIVPPKLPPVVSSPRPPIFVPPHAPPIVKPPIVRSHPKPFVEPIKITSGTKRLNLTGSNLVGERGFPEVRLNNKPLSIADADNDFLVIEMPEEAESGALEIILPDGERMSYELSYEDDEPPQYENGEEWREGNRHQSFAKDSWEPERDY